MSGLIDSHVSLAQRVWRLVSPGKWLYVILDAARDPSILERICALRPESESLYRGRGDQTLWEIAPYLVRLEPETEFGEWLFREGWGKHWGIWGISSADLTVVHRHFRRFLDTARATETGSGVRYYDPHVLRQHLPECDTVESAVIFGPMSAFFAEDDDPARVVQFRLGPDGVIVEHIELEATPTPVDCAAGETFQMVSDTVLETRTPRIRRVTLIRQSGNSELAKIWLRPGQNVSVGRSDQSDFVIPQDDQMCESHFSIECTWTICRIRDLGSRDGTFVNGQRVESMSLHAGDEIVAGHTSFLVHVDHESAVAAMVGENDTAGALPGTITSHFEPPPSRPVLTAKLEITRGPYDGRIVELHPNVAMTIGRQSTANLPLEQDPSISRVHCRIEFLPPECRVVDLGSSYGTHVNGRRITDARLRDGDQIRIGNSDFRIRITPLA